MVESEWRSEQGEIAGYDRPRSQAAIGYGWGSKKITPGHPGRLCVEMIRNNHVVNTDLRSRKCRHKPNEIER